MKSRRTVSSWMAAIMSLEHVEALPLVLHHGVVLAVGPQADALAQLVHGVDVVHPVLVHHPQHDHPLQLPHRAGVAELLLPWRRRRRLALLEQQVGQLLGASVPASSSSGEIAARPGGKNSVPDSVSHSSRQSSASMCCRSPMWPWTPAGTMTCSSMFRMAALQVLAVQHLAALLVDDLALGVHHVVVLQHVLTGLEVPGLHLLLGVLDGVGEHLAVDGRVLVHAQASPSCPAPARSRTGA